MHFICADIHTYEQLTRLVQMGYIAVCMRMFSKNPTYPILEISEQLHKYCR